MVQSGCKGLPLGFSLLPCQNHASSERHSMGWARGDVCNFLLFSLITECPNPLTLSGFVNFFFLLDSS